MDLTHGTQAVKPSGTAEDGLRLLVDSIPALVHTARPDGYLDYFNKPWLEYLGVTLDEVIGWKWTVFLHPDDVDGFVADYRAGLASGKHFEAEGRVRRADGQYRTFLHRKVPWRDEQGNIVKWYGSSVDIEDRKRAEEALRRKEFYLAEAQRLARMGTWAFSAAGFDYWSSNLFQVYGLDSSGKPPTVEEYLALVHPEDRGCMEQTIQKMLTDHRGFDFIKRVVRPDGEIRYIRCVGVPEIRGETFQGFVGTGIDVTDQEKLTEELRRSEFYLAEGQRLGHAGSWSFKPDFTCDYWSRELYEILHFDPKQGIPTISDYFTRVHPGDRAVVEATIQRMIAAGEGCDIKKRIILPDGVQRVIRCVGMPVREYGVITRFVGTLMDITEQEELTQELRRREALLAMEKRLLEMIATGEVLDEILNALCLIIEEQRSGTLASVLLLNPDGVHLRSAAGPKLPDQWIQQMEKLPIGPCAGSCGTAAYRKSPVIVSDIANDPLWNVPEHRASALKHGLRASWSWPVLSSKGNVLGTFCMYYREPRSPDARDLDLIEAATHLVRVAIERDRAEEGLRRSEAYLTEAQRLGHTGSFGWNVSTDDHFWSEETFRIFEFAPSSKVSLQMILERIHPEDMPSVKMAIAAANRAEGIDLEFRLLMLDGRIKHLHVVAAAERRETGRIEVVGAVMDVTARKLIEIELRRSKQHLADAQRLSRTGSVGMELSTKRVFWSEEAARIYGYPPGTEPTPDLILRRSHPDDAGLLKDVLERAAQGGNDFDFEHRLVMPDGSIKHLHDLSHRVWDEAGNEEVVGAIVDITERKHAEETIRRSEAYLAEAQKLSHTGSFGWKPDSGEIVWSDETYRIFEYDRTLKPTVDSVLQRVHPYDMAVTQQVIDRASQTGTDFEHEYRLLMPDGRVKHVHAIAHALQDARRNREFVGAVTDITERKTAAEALRSSEAYLAEAQRLSKTGSWAWSPDQDIRYWSEECYRILSFDPQDGLPRFKEFFQRLHPDDQPSFRELIQTATREKTEWEADYRIVHPDGPVRNIHVVGHPVLSTSGHLIEFVGTVIDVTERKRAEEERRRSEVELRQMLDLVPQQVAVYGPLGEKLYANRILLDYLGLTLEEWQLRSPRGELLHPDDKERRRAYFEGACASGSSFELESRLRKSDGSYRWFLARYNPLRDEQGRIMRWYVAGTDIEDRKQAEERLQQENVALREEVDKASMFEEIVGASPALQAVLADVAKVAPTESTVLITGETGTGKELIGRAIHKRSARSSGSFVSINCAAIPRDLVASELFGHEKGAFTGALQRRLGRFEVAAGGTIFLDEVGDLPAETQIALLRVLQEREFDRVGGSRPIRADVRVIAATNRDLQAAITDGAFRSDLFYRLNVFPIHIPPLRQRKEDVPILVEYFIDRYASKAGKNIRGITKKTLDLLQSYPWPGNIRELQNVIERAVIVSETETLLVEESWLLPPAAFLKAPGSAGGGAATFPLSKRSEDEEKQAIEAALAATRGRVAGPRGAAAKLGIPASTLESKIRLLKINKYRFKN